MRAFALLAMLALGSACGAAAHPGSNYPVIKIDCPVRDAKVWVDERFVAPVRAIPAGFRVPPGTHRIEVEYQGYHTRYFEVTVALGETRTLEVQLAESLP
jgi:hypothetical protein